MIILKYIVVCRYVITLDIALKIAIHDKNNEGEYSLQK